MSQWVSPQFRRDSRFSPDQFLGNVPSVPGFPVPGFPVSVPGFPGFLDTWRLLGGKELIGKRG
jgi:hypothetical protein